VAIATDLKLLFGTDLGQVIPGFSTDALILTSTDSPSAKWWGIYTD